ncbi:MAG: hypothetical protein ACW98A_13500 [Candidatus Hodarchaeales archaeon]|jgi:hypothetical protein
MPRKTRKRTKTVKKSVETNDLSPEIKLKQEKDYKITDITPEKPSSSKSKKIKSTKEATKVKEPEITLELQIQIEKLSADNKNLINALRSKDEIIESLKTKLSTNIKKADEVNNNHEFDLEIERWRESALVMSQFIAEKMGFTQGEILQRFGMADS